MVTFKRSNIHLVWRDYSFIWKNSHRWTHWDSHQHTHSIVHSHTVQDSISPNKPSINKRSLRFVLHPHKSQFIRHEGFLSYLGALWSVGISSSIVMFSDEMIHTSLPNCILSWTIQYSELSETNLCTFIGPHTLNTCCSSVTQLCIFTLYCVLCIYSGPTHQIHTVICGEKRMLSTQYFRCDFFF